MKKMYKIFTVLMIFAASAGHSQISFVADNTSGCAPMTINFTNTSSSGDHFYWSFGDGNSLNDVTEGSNFYQYAGIYTVYLDAYDASWNYLGWYSMDIVLDGQPNGIYQSAEITCPNDPVFFQIDQTSNSYTWDFGDGTVITTDYPYTDHAYTSSGTFNVSVEFFSSCGYYVTANDVVTVDGSLPFFGGYPQIGLYETTVCPGSPVSMDAYGGSYQSYSWDFGNGNFSTDQYTTTTYSSIGSYNIELTLTNGCGIDTVLNEIINVTNSVPAPIVTIDGPTEICPGDQVYYNVSGGPYGLDYTWDFGDGTALFNTNDTYAYHSFDIPGFYNIQLTVENACGNTSVSTLMVESSTTAPVFGAYFDIYPNEICPGDEINYWVPYEYDYYINFGDGNGETDGYSHSYNSVGVYPVYVIVQNSCGMTETLYDTVYVQNNLPISDNVYMGAYPDPACPGASIEFYAAYGYAQYEWSFGDGYTSSYESVSHPYLNPGTYPVSLTITNGCGSDTTLNDFVDVVSNLPIDQLDWGVFGQDVCPGTTVYMAAEDEGGLTYSWDFGDGSTSTDFLASHVYNVPGTYTITLNAVNGCGSDSTVTYQLDVVNGQTPDFSMIEFMAQTPGCIGDNLYFAVQPAGVGTYSWDFGDGNSGFSDQIIISDGLPIAVGFHSYNSTGTYLATLTVTNTCGNSADSTIEVQVGGFGSGVPADVYFWHDETEVTCEGQPVTFYAVGSSTYIWDFGDGTGSLITYNSLSPVEHIYEDDGNYMVTVVGLNSCGNSGDNNEAIFIPDSKINVITNTVQEADCGVNNGVAIVSATGGTQPYTYSWTNGDQYVIADSLGSGIYVVSVTDNNGCSTEAIAAVSDEQGPVIILENIVHNECFGENNGVISVSVLGGAPPYTILWSNGDATEEIFNLEAGPYEIFVTDANGCFAVKSFTVEQPAESVVSVYTENATCGSNNGTATAVISNAVPPFNFIWPNTSGPSNTTGGLAPGVYELLVIDGNTCLLGTTFAVNEMNGPVIVTDSIADPTCSGDLSAIYISTIGGAGPFIYEWSDGSTSQDLTGVLPGEYSVEVEGSNGCSSFQHFDVAMSAPDETDICIVTVDTLTNSNLVVWNPVNAADVVSYNIYKESSQSGLYFLVANQSADSISQYYDYPSNPAIRSWRYKVAAVDDCGNIAELSNPHKTIHLTSNIGVGGVINLIWDHYNGFSYDTYYIHRYHPSTGWMIIDSVGSLNISYTDLTPPSDSNLVYMIEVLPPSVCTASKAQDHNSSRSNKSSVNMPDAGETTGITENNNEALSIYPNPTSGIAQLIYSGIISEVKVYSLSGELVFSSANSENTLTLDCSSFADGIYTIQITTENGILYSKLVKQ